MEQEAIIEPKKSVIHFFCAGIFFIRRNWLISKIKDDFSSVSFALSIFMLQ